MMKNIAVLVSGGGTNLQALIDAQNRGEIIGGKITLVVSSNPDAYALKRAENNNIATKTMQNQKKAGQAEDWELSEEYYREDTGKRVNASAKFMEVTAMRKIKELIFSENGMKAVNTLFFLAMFFYSSGLLFVAYIVWICYLVFCIRNTESRGSKVVYSVFVGLAVVMIGVSLYGLIQG